MKLIKKINNNFVLAEDGKGKSIIVEGKGIGFLKMPCEIKDFEGIEEIYYNSHDRYLHILKSVPESLLEVSSKITSYAQKKLNTKLNQNLIFILADHINFAFIRQKKGIDFDMGLSFEISYLYPEEMDIGRRGLKFINSISKIKLPESEAAILAMHIVEAEASKQKMVINDTNLIIDDIIQIIENVLNLEINKEGFSYYRFATHLKYLLNRKNKNQFICTENECLFKQIVTQFPEIYQCMMVIKRYFADILNWNIKEEEQLYLLIHINRIKEDCNLK